MSGEIRLREAEKAVEGVAWNSSKATSRDAALEWLSGLGYSVLHGPDIAPDGSTPERISYGGSGADGVPAQSA